jgi:hypothetical protein
MYDNMNVKLLLMLFDMKIKLRYKVCWYDNKIALKCMLIFKWNFIKYYVDMKETFVQ